MTSTNTILFLTALMFMVFYFIQVKKIAKKYNALAKSENALIREELKKDSRRVFLYVLAGLVVMGLLMNLLKTK